MSITRAELIERLKKLAESKPPNRNELAYGAMCYYPAFDETDDWPVCEHCGRSWDGRKFDINKIVNQHKDFVMRLQQLGLGITLIVPELCPTCGKIAAGKTFVLEIKYPDRPDPIRFQLHHITDLQLMERFLQGQDRYVGECDEEYPLKNKINRIADLFGVKEDG